MRLRARHGLTLLELLVALVVTAATAALGYAALGAVADARAAGVARAEEVAGVAAKRRQLRAWIASAHVGAAGDVAFEGRNAQIRVAGAALGNDELTLLTLDAGRPVRLRLHVDRDTGTPERGLVAALTAVPAIDGASERRVEIDPSAESLELIYLAVLHEGRRWVDGWNSASILPEAVQVRIAAPPGGAVHVLLAMPLTVPVGAAR